jgi:hypothetical protein
MRKVGYLLLIVGFTVVIVQASGRIKHALWVAREQKEALPQQDSFTRRQVEDTIVQATLATRESGAAAVLPSVLMACGAVLLDRAKTKRHREEKIA